MRKILRVVLLVTFSILLAFPLLYLISMSFFTPQDFISSEARFLPSTLSFDNYMKAFGNKYLTRQLMNSIATSSLTASIRLVVTILAAFAFTHMHFKGKALILTLLTATLFVPQDALIYQNYRTIANLSLLDSYIGIIAPSLFSATQILLLMGAFSSISKDFYDRARMDGASDTYYIVKILSPLAKSVLITIFLQAFIGSFNSYLWPLLVTNKPKTRTIQVGLTMLGFSEQGAIGAEMAAITMMVIPFVIILAFGKKWIEKALINSSMHQ